MMPIVRPSLAAGALVALVLSGCRQEEAPEPKGTEDPTTSDPTEPPTDTTPPTVPTADTGGTGSVTDTGPELVIDCSAIPDAPLSITQLVGPKGYHDVIFDDAGQIIGSDNNSLIASDYSGNWSIYAAGFGMVQQMDWLPDGDMVIARDSDSTLVRLTPGGGSSVLAGFVDAYGVILGPDEMIYAATQDQVVRVDPATGQKTVLVDMPGVLPRVLNFSLDFTKLYFGTYLGSNGRIYVVDLDANLDPVSPPTVFASGVGSGSYHDTLGVDICGNLYVADYSTNDLFRITPDGQVSLLVDFNFTNYGHGMEWGNGVGGWREDAIYMAQPYNNNNVMEIVIGVTSRSWEGTVIR